jgi:hypothetical protein
MWWTYETGIELSTEVGINVGLDATLIRDVADGVEIYSIGELSDEESRKVAARVGQNSLAFVECVRFSYGAIYPDDLADHVALRRLEGVLACLAFLNSPYIPKTSQRLARAERRELARKQAPDFGDEITFVTLRRPEPRRHEHKDDAAAVEWKHRWIVSGHYRAQWYPSEAAHHVIWIAPYLKGPEDAPLFEHAYRVAR